MQRTIAWRHTKGSPKAPTQAQASTDTNSARRRQRSQRSLFLGSRFRFHFHFRFRRFCFFWEKSRTAAARSNNTTPAHTGTPLRNPRPPFWGLAHSDLCLGFDSLCALEIQKSKKTQKCSYLVDRGIGAWGLGGLGPVFGAHAWLHSGSATHRGAFT